MSDSLAPVVRVTLPLEATHPEDVLRAVAAQITGQTGGDIEGSVWSQLLQGWLATYILDAWVTRPGPGQGLLQVDHRAEQPYPAYVTAPCFGEVWPLPPLGPSDPSYKIAPAAHNAQELADLINQVLASPQARDSLAYLLRQRKKLTAENGAARNGAPVATETVQADAGST